MQMAKYVFGNIGIIGKVRDRHPVKELWRGRAKAIVIARAFGFTTASSGLLHAYGVFQEDRAELDPKLVIFEL
jgi:hypothetical protein